MPIRTARRLTTLASGALLVGAWGCDIPTEAPIVDQRWSAPVESTRFGVADLLPNEVGLTPDSGAFVLDMGPASFSASLGSICPPCSFANGLTVPKPAFADTLGDDVSFPARVTSVTVLGGRVRVRITNGLNFDPLRPAAGVFGGLSIVLADGSDGDILGTWEADGATTAFASGDTLDIVIPLASTVLDGAIEADISIDSPAGDPVTIDASLRLGVTAEVEELLVSEVAVDVSGESVTLDPSTLDLDDVGDELVDRVTSGAILLDVKNPFGIGAVFDIGLQGSTFATIRRTPSVLGAAEETIRLDFTLSEIRQILSAPSVTITGQGSVDPAAGIIRVRPGESLEIEARLDVELRLGG